MLGNLLKTIDIYGHPIGMTYKGSGSFSTRLGGVLSLMTFILICINTKELILSFSDHSNQKEKVYSLSEDLFDMEPIFLHEN